MENILSRFDKDGDGIISVTEFVDFFFTNSGEKATKSLGSLERKKSGMFSNMGGLKPRAIHPGYP